NVRKEGVGYFANLSPKPPTGSSQLPATSTTTRTPALGVDAAQPDLLTHQQHPASAPSCSPSPHASHIPPITPPLPQSSTLVDPADQCSQPPNSLKFYRAWTASPIDIELDSSALSLASSPSGFTPRGSHVPSSPRWWFGKWPLCSASCSPRPATRAPGTSLASIRPYHPHPLIQKEKGLKICIQGCM
ncbi:hypothetical protein, variant, partial [Puccinia triticina 1-1 BBBD Race 1]